MSLSRRLLISSLALPSIQANAETPMQFDYSYQLYQEDDDRIRVESSYIRGKLDFNEDFSFRFQWLDDAISGASPTGEYDENGKAVLADLTDRRKGILGALSKKFGDSEFELEFSESTEHDYLSRGIALSGSTELNEKNTTISYGFNYLDDQVTVPLRGELDKNSYDFFAGVSQIVDENTVISVNLTLGYSEGYLNDPYKVIERDEITKVNVPVTVQVDVPVTVQVDVPVKVQIPDGLGGFIETEVITKVDTVVITKVDTIVNTTVDVPVTNKYVENRPDKRFRQVLQLEGLHYFKAANAGLNAELRFSHDDYGVFSQTANVEWRQSIGKHFTAVPFFRYYNQNAADFFYNNLNSRPNAKLSNEPDGSGFNYSSDYRLSSFNAVSGGIRLRYEISEYLSANAAYERYVMSGSGDKADRASDDAYISADIWTFGINATF
jgi:hypothetical protein